MLAHGHETVGLNGISGMIDLTIDYRSPWTQLLSVHMMGGEAQHLDVFDGGAGDHTTTNVRLTLAGSSVPKNWRVDWNVAGYGGFGTSGQLTGEVVDFRVVNGSAVELSVSHDLATGILGNNRRPPATSVRLLFDRARVVSAASLL